MLIIIIDDMDNTLILDNGQIRDIIRKDGDEIVMKFRSKYLFPCCNCGRAILNNKEKDALCPECWKEENLK